MTLRKRLFSVAGTFLLAVSPTALVLAQDAQAPTSAVETPAIPSQKTGTPDREKPNAPHAVEKEPVSKPAPPKSESAMPESAMPASPKPAPAVPAPATEPNAPKPPPVNGEASAPAAKSPARPADEKGPGKPEAAEPTAGQAPAKQAAPSTPPASLDRQRNAATPPQPKAGGAGKNDHAAPVAGATANEGPASAFLRDQRPASQLSDDDLRQRLLDGRRLLADPTLSQAQRDALRRLVQSSREEFQHRQAAATADTAPPRNRPTPGARPAPPPADADEGRLITPPSHAATDPAAEQRAVGLLADGTPLDRMSDQALRQHLGAYRSALAAGSLSPATERGLIQRLDAARAALRGRVAEQEDGVPPSGWTKQKQGPAEPGWDPQFGKPQFRLGSPRPQDIPAILADRRPSAVLTFDQLNRRILVFRDAANDPRYSPDDREAFAQYLQSDRNELHNRLINDRGQRGSRLQRAAKGGRLHLDVDILPRGGLRAHSIWAAEVDDDQIEQQFAARPLQPLPQRFPRAILLSQPEMVMEQPFVRRAIPSVELDTIHFGFNEAFIREEEVAHLDRVGRIIERMVAAHPDEVFVIEGNTDAVGDDAYNLQLSKKRAEAVKQALTQFYLIAPRNLVTAGLGERYLKILTQDPEQENRRVTLRRITPVLQD